MSRLVILTEGKSNPDSAKTATGVLRYRGEDVVALLDSTQAGRTCGEVLGVGGSIPIVATLAEVDADTLLVGIAPAGGALPDAWRQVIREAIHRGMDIVSGLHTFLGDDEELRTLATEKGVELRDLRRLPSEPEVARDLVRGSGVHRIHTVGQDCSVGKMVVSMEIDRALRDSGRDSEFIASGQTGILVAGSGVPADRVISDFVSGAVEAEVLARENREFVVVEGQGDICHPLYSAVTLGLLHGCAPQTMVLVYDPTREIIKSSNLPVVPLRKLIPAYETVASFLCPSKVAALAANTSMLSAAEARRTMAETEDELGLPTVDVIRDGCARIVEVILGRHAKLGLE